jgi:hypothetical protein
MHGNAETTTSPRIESWEAALSRGEEVTLYRSRLKSVLLALLMLLIGLISFAVGLTAELPIALIGWLMVLISALSVVVLVRRAFSTVPAAVVSGEGIAVGRATAGPVPWSQITDISVMRSGASSFVILAVTDQERRRQSGDAAGVELDLESADEDSQPVLWLPNGLKADENELVIWLNRERAARVA